LLSVSPPHLILRLQGLEEAKNPAGKALRLIQDRLSDAEFAENLVCSSSPIAATESLLQAPQTHSLFIDAHNETLSVVAMRVSNPDCSPVAILSETLTARVH
jgi:hypothetical protein